MRKNKKYKNPSDSSSSPSHRPSDSVTQQIKPSNLPQIKLPQITYPPPQKNENIDLINTKERLTSTTPLQKGFPKLAQTIAPKPRQTAYLVANRHQEIERLKIFRPIMSRNKRRKILRAYSMIKRISKCNSKMELTKIFTSLNSKWKKLIKKYMENCFLIHLHLRQIKDFSELMQHRQNIYDALDDPAILDQRVNFANNLVKNFCKGFVNFVVMFLENLIEMGLLEEKRRFSCFDGVKTLD